jgi:hypothetical protein
MSEFGCCCLFVVNRWNPGGGRQCIVFEIYFKFQRPQARGTRLNRFVDLSLGVLLLSAAFVDFL